MQAARVSWPQQLQLPIIGPHPGDQFWIDGLPQQSTMFGFPQPCPSPPRAGCTMATLCELGRTLHVRHCPGHTPWHVVFHSPQ
jgi:hydroxyacylglutathione hydrolase